MMRDKDGNVIEELRKVYEEVGTMSMYASTEAIARKLDQ